MAGALRLGICTLALMAFMVWMSQGNGGMVPEFIVRDEVETPGA
jgi:hypothetical protein